MDNPCAVEFTGSWSCRRRYMLTGKCRQFRQLPKSFSLDNFAETMRVTDFWNSLGNSVLITGAAIILSLVIHSMAGYAIGRSMARHKGFKFIYFYGNTAQLLSRRCAVNFFDRLHKKLAGILAYVKRFLCDMTEKLQADVQQRRQPLIVRCCPISSAVCSYHLRF